MFEKIRLQSSGFLKLSSLINYYERILGQSLGSYTFAFYKIANKIQANKWSTMEFIYLQGLCLEDELNINEFLSKIIIKLKLENELGINVFRALDVEKKGKITVENFVMVIDSYRDKEKKRRNKTNESEKESNADSEEMKRNAFEGIDGKLFTIADQNIFWINKFLELLKSIEITEKMCFENSKESPFDKEINVDSMKRKLKLMLPQNKTSAIELNNIADAFDINKNRKINYEEYSEIISKAQDDPKYNVISKQKQNIYPLISYMSSANKNISDLPLRNNPRFFEDPSKSKMRIAQTNNEEEKNRKNEEEIHNINELLPEEEREKLEDDKQESTYVNLFGEEKEALSKEMNEFVRNLDVFEAGEWSLINLCEDFDIPENEKLAPCTTLYKILEDKFCPTIEKDKISIAMKEIDKNMDGLFSYIDLILFLKKIFNYYSTKLGWKEVTRKIIYEHNQSPENYLNSNLNLVENIHNEISFASFVKFLSGNFAIPPEVAKAMYDDLQGIIVNHKITRADIIDTINRQIELNDSKTKKENEENNIVDGKNYLRSINKNNNNYYSAISLLDKKYYEQEMKNFVSILQRAFIPSNSQDIEETLKNNLILFVNFPEKVKLSQFREYFIKPLSMDYALGICTFQIAKTFKNSSQGTNDNSSLMEVQTSSLMKIILSYINYDIINFDARALIFFIENGKYPPLKFCFESIPYNYKGITTIEIMKFLEIFYPKLHKTLIKELVKCIDEQSTGLISFYALTNFIFNYSIKEENMYSTDLMLKYVASLIDLKKMDTEKYLRNYIITNDKRNKHVSIDSHNRYFVSELLFDEKQTENLFIYLSNINQNGKYALSRLVCLINQIRTRQTNVGIFPSEKETSEDYKKISYMLNEMNKAIPFCELFHKLSIDKENLGISVIELDRVIKQTYSSNLDIDNSVLIALYKTLDKNGIGVIEYYKFHFYFKSHFLEGYKGCYLLHLKYLANKYYKEFKGKWSNYLNYKGIIGNKYINKNNFDILFKKEECFGDDDLAYILFEFLKEKTSNNANLMYIQNYIDYLRNLSSSEEEESEVNEAMEEIDVVECENIIKESIETYEKNGGCFPNFFDEIQYEKQVNSFGKIHWEYTKKVLLENFSFDDLTLTAYKKYFCRLTNLFDLFKLATICSKYTKYKLVDEEIRKKLEIKISNNKSEKEFFGYLNIPPEIGNTVSKFVIYCKSIFELNAYESILIFIEMMDLEENPHHQKLKVSFDFMIKYFKLQNCFTETINEENEKEIKDPLLDLAIERFAVFLQRKKDIKNLFQEYDLDNDGFLERDEFYQLLIDTKIPNLNDDLKLKIANKVDADNDGNIDYEELIDFMTNYEITDESLKKSLNISEKEEFESKITDINAMEQRYNINLNILKGYKTNNAKVSKWNKLCLSLQLNLFTKGNNTVEKQLYDINESNDIGDVPLDSFYDILYKNSSIQFDDKLKRKLSQKFETKQIDEEYFINYFPFIQYIEFFDLPESKLKEIKEEEKNVTSESEEVKEEEIKKETPVEEEKSEHKEEEEEKEEESNKSKKKKIQEEEKSENEEKENKIKKFKKGLVKMYKKNANINGIIGNEEKIRKMHHIFYKTFKLDRLDDKAKKSESDSFSTLAFSKLIDKVETVENKLIFADYQLKNEDYFKCSENKDNLNTILNSEEAALKKCEEFFYLLGEKESWIDPDFGNDNVSSLYINNRVPEGQLDTDQIAWYRINEINPQGRFIKNIKKRSEKEVIQGALGDSWFISALSILASSNEFLLKGEFNEKMLLNEKIPNEDMQLISSGIYPPIFYPFRKKGIFCFRFYKDLKWRYVIIDDRLPCQKVMDVSIQKPRLLYSKCRNDDEFWASLIEKAYAKLHGSYEKLMSGSIEEGLKDLSGLTPKIISFDGINSMEKTNPEKQIQKDKLWQTMKDFISDISNEISVNKNISKDNNDVIQLYNNNCNCLIQGASINKSFKSNFDEEAIFEGERCGLITGQGYSILNVLEIPKDQSKNQKRKFSRLILLKNISGLKEWNGKWSDNSDEVENNREELLKQMKSFETGMTSFKEDGKFLISFSDFINIFSKLYLVNKFPYPSYISFYFEDSWNIENESTTKNTSQNINDFSKYPQYLIEVKKPTMIRFELIQKDLRITDNSSIYFEETCLILSSATNIDKVEKIDSKSFIASSSWKRSRENLLEINLNIGKYILSCGSSNNKSNSKFYLVVIIQDSFKNDSISNLKGNIGEELNSISIKHVSKTDNNPILMINPINQKDIEENQKKEEFIYLMLKNELKNFESKEEEK